MGIATWCGHHIDHLEQILFPVCGDFLTGCGAVYNDVGAALGEAKRLYLPPAPRVRR